MIVRVGATSANLDQTCANPSDCCTDSTITANAQTLGMVSIAAGNQKGRWAIHFIATPAHGDPPPEANGAGQGLEHSRGGSQMDSPQRELHAALLLLRRGIASKDSHKPVEIVV